MELAKEKKLIELSSEQIICYLIPSIIVPKGNPKKIKTLSDLSRKGLKVGIGNPKNVCVGLYAVEVMEKANMLDKIMKNIVTYAESCEKTANLIVLGQVDAILGWSVFEHWNPQKMQAVFIDKKMLPRAGYIPIAITTFARDKTLAQDFLNFVMSDKGKDIYKKWGYITDKTEALTYTKTSVVGGEYKLPANYKNNNAK